MLTVNFRATIPSSLGASISRISVTAFEQVAEGAPVVPARRNLRKSTVLMHRPCHPRLGRQMSTANELAVRIAAQEQQAALLAAARAGQAGAADNGFSFWISKIPPYAAWDYKTNLDLSTRPSAISTLVQLAISSAWPCMCVRGVRGQRHMAPLRSRSRKKGSRTRGGTRLCTSGLQAQVILQGRQRTITECLSMATKPAVSRTKRLLLGMAMRPGRKRVECCHSSSGGGPNCGS